MWTSSVLLPLHLETFLSYSTESREPDQLRYQHSRWHFEQDQFLVSPYHHHHHSHSHPIMCLDYQQMHLASLKSKTSPSIKIFPCESFPPSQFLIHQKLHRSWFMKKMNSQAAFHQCILFLSRLEIFCQKHNQNIQKSILYW